MAEVTGSILVDTHFILWLRVAPRALTRSERDLIENCPRLHVSIVSFWEIAIMQTVGRLRKDTALLETPPGFELLTVRQTHCRAYAALPIHHRDPFDRMLIAQAQVEHVPLLTRDRRIADYSSDATILRFPEA
jgi:PIN domain nuclease of toxin-antitoxin system